MNCERFSQEIFDIFIDSFSHSVSDLKNLSLVSKPWKARARKHLFRYLRISPIILDSDEHKTRMLDSWQNFIANPEIQHSVRGIILDNEVWQAGLRFDGAGDGNLNVQGQPFAGSLQQLLNTLPIFAGQLSAHGLVGLVGFPCSELDALPSFILESLSYEWGTSCRFSSQPTASRSRPDNIALFANVLRRYGDGLKDLHLSSLGIYVPKKQYKKVPALDPFEILAAFAPSVTTLCLSGLFYTKDGRYPAHGAAELIPALRQLFEKPSHAFGSFAGERKIMLRRFCFRNSSKKILDSLLSNDVLNVILFQNKFLKYTDLVCLAINTRSIPLFRNVFPKITHLTLFEDAGWIHEDWHYNLARFSLPSLMSLQLVVSGYGALLASCRGILGPTDVTESFQPTLLFGQEHMEWPGTHSYSDLPSPPAATITPATYPEPGRGIHLHIEFPRENWILNMSLNQRVDKTLLSYLNLGTAESSGSLDYITVNQADTAGALWPLTRASGRFGNGEGDLWWDARRR